MHACRSTLEDPTIEECFAPALRFKVLADGTITDTPAEPIAADARPHADGRAGAKLKLLAGLLGVSFDELKQREKRRQLWQRLQVGAAMLAFAGLCTGAWQWYLDQRAAREREIAIEKIVESGRLELLDGHQARAAVLLNQAYSMGYDTPALRFMLGQAMKPVDALTPVQVKQDGYTIYRAAAFSPDGRSFVLGARKEVGGVQTGTARIYDASTGTGGAELPRAPLLILTSQFLPQQRLLVTGYPDELLTQQPVTVIWDLARPAEPMVIEGVNGQAGKATNADGSRFLVASPKGLQVRATQDAKLVTTLGGGRSIVAASYSSDGSQIALADERGSVELWSADTARLERHFADASQGEVVALVFAPSGHRLLALSARGDVRVWDSSDGRLLLAFAADPDYVADLRFDHSGNRLLTIGREGYKVWSMLRGGLLFSIARTLDQYAGATLSPDGDMLITTDSTSSVAEAWDVRSKRKLYSLDLHSSGICAGAFDEDGRRFLLASRDGQAEIWQMPIVPSWKYESFKTYPYAARFERGASRFLAGGGDYVQGSGLVFDVKKGDIVQRVEGHAGVVYDFDESPSADRFLTASRDGTAILWDAAQGKKIAVFDHRPYEVASARFDSTGSRVLTATNPATSGSHADKAGLWDAQDGHLIAWLTHDDRIVASSFDPDGRRIATASAAADIKLWSAQDGHLLQILRGHRAMVVSLAFSKDGRQLLSAGQDHQVRIWNTEDGTTVDSLSDDTLTPVTATYSPDERKVAIGMESGSIALWSPLAHAVATLKGHQQPVSELRYSKDGQILFSDSFDGTARAWDAVSGKELGVVAMHPGPINSLDLDDSSGTLLTASWSQIRRNSVGPERRAPGEVARLLGCGSPWQFDAVSLGLVPAAPNPAACGWLRK